MVIIALAAILAQDPVTGERSIVSKCPVETDAEWGYTKAKPIKVGGSPMYGPARQRQFLQTLVGPGGQPIAFKRRGSYDSGDPRIILDLYEVTYAGLEKPIELYLDLYRWEVPRAPSGFLCGSEMRLAPPPPDPFAMHEKLLAEAIARSAVDSLPPIPIDDARPERGVLFDSLRVVTLAAREIVRKGRTPTPRDLATVPAEMVVVAAPVTCGAETVEPEGIGLVTSRGQSIPGRGPLLTGGALRDRLPGIELPKGAVAAVFSTHAPPASSSIAIKYRGTACGDQPSMFLMRIGGPRRVSGAGAVMPAGMEADGYIGHATVKVRYTVGPDGRPSDLSVVSGEARFAEAALEAVRQWRYGLSTVNGHPVFIPMTITTDVSVVKR